jgi:hypothetical protein
VLAAVSKGRNWKAALSSRKPDVARRAVGAFKAVLVATLKTTIPEKLTELLGADAYTQANNILECRHLKVQLGLSHPNSCDVFQPWARARTS